MHILALLREDNDDLTEIEKQVTKIEEESKSLSLWVKEQTADS